MNKKQACSLIVLGVASSVPAVAEQVIEQQSLQITGRQAEMILPGNSASASKLNLSVHETPQAVSVVQRPLMESQGALSTGEILKNVSGVTYSGGEGRRDQFYIRGFDARRDTLVDGYRDDSLYFRDPVNVESVEVLKGPSSVTHGRSDGGGMINRTSKQPTGERIASAKVIVGTDALYRSELDLGNRLSDTLDYRLTMAVEDSESFRDFVTSKRYSINPSARWQVSDHTSVLAQLEYLNQERTPDRGIPSVNGAPAPVDISNYYGENYDFSDNEVANLRLVMDHAFSDSLALKSALIVSSAELDAINTRPNGLADAEHVKRRSFLFPQKQTNYMWVNDLTWNVQVGDVAHEIVTGVELSQQQRDLWVDSVYIENANIQTPAFTFPAVTFDTPYIDHRFKSVNKAAYVQDLMRFSDQWQLLAGVRYDYSEQKQTNNLTGAEIKRTDESVNPRLGLVYQPNTQTMFYASGAQSYRPISHKLFEFRDYNWDQEPQESVQFELGMKQRLFDDSGSLNIALFDLTKENVATADPSNEFKFLQTGEQRSRGVELDFVAQLSPAWQLYANATVMNSEVTADNTFDVGNRLERAAERSAGIWSDYRFNNGVVAGLGAFYVGDRYADLNNSVRIPAYTRIDASVGYVTADYELRLNIENLTDKRYYAEANSKDRITPGGPLAARLSYTLRF